jgi:hypothetical protein
MFVFLQYPSNGAIIDRWFFAEHIKNCVHVFYAYPNNDGSFGFLLCPMYGAITIFPYYYITLQGTN